MTVIGRTKKIIVLTVLFVLLVALLVFAVIGLRNIGEDKTAVYRDAGATVKVTFVANGGTINGGGSYYRMVKPGDLVLEPGKELSDGTVTAGAVLTGHTLASWNLGTVHEDGTVELGEAVDFSTFRPTEDTVCKVAYLLQFPPGGCRDRRRAGCQNRAARRGRAGAFHCCDLPFQCGIYLL